MTAFVISAILSGCDSDDGDENVNGNGNGNEGTGTELKVSLTVTDIEDNHATISASLTEGEFYGAQLVEAVNLNTVTVDYTNEVRLISFVMENGVDVDLPYTNTVFDLRADVDMFSAVIVYDSDGRAATSAYVVWTAEGESIYWSEDNSAGDLPEEKW